MQTLTCWELEVGPSFGGRAARRGSLPRGVRRRVLRAALGLQGQECTL